MTLHELFDFAVFLVAFAAAMLASSMSLLAALYPRSPWQIAPLSALLAAPIAYGLVNSVTHWPLPDPENWTALGTMILAVAAMVGIYFSISTLRAIRDESVQNARRTAALVEAAWPYLRTLIDNPRHLPKKRFGRWSGRFRHELGSTPARDVEVWLREPSGHYFATLALVFPGEIKDFTLHQASPQLASKSPFAVMDDQPLGGQGWIGITWICPDARWRYDLMAFTFGQSQELVEAYPHRTDLNYRRPLSTVIRETEST